MMRRTTSGPASERPDASATDNPRPTHRRESGRSSATRARQREVAVAIASVSCTGASVHRRFPAGAAENLSGEQRAADVVALATPGGTANSAEPVCWMYSFSASWRARLVCIGTKCCTGSRMYAMKNNPASRLPSPFEPSVKL